MKNLKQHITETGAVGIDSFTAPDVDGYDTFNITNPEVLKRVNSFVSSIADREYMLTEKAIGKLRNFLMRLGLQFPDTPLPEAAGTISLPLSQWGGRFGKDLDTPYDEFVNDDGITDRIPGGLSLEIKTEAVANGSWKVYAKIK